MSKEELEKSVFENKKAILAIETELANKKHEFRMIELSTERENNLKFFEQQKLLISLKAESIRATRENSVR